MSLTNVAKKYGVSRASVVRFVQGSTAASGCRRRVSSRTPKMKKSGSNETDIVVIAVPSVEQARVDCGSL